MKKDRILIVGSFQKPEKQKIFGGIAKSCYEILNSKSFSEFDIITIDSTSLSVPPPNYIIRLIFALKRIIQLIIKLSFEKPACCLFFCSDGSSAIEKGLMIIISKIFGIKCLIFPRAGNLINQVKRNQVFKFYIKNLFKQADKFLCQGEDWQKFALEILKINNSKLEVVPNWTATEELLKLGIDRKINSNKELQLLYVGWLIKEKGISELLKSFKDIISKNYKVKLLIIGDGPYATEINQFIIKNNLHELINISGWLNSKDLLEAYKQSDIFILPSWQEGMPNALIEALATGLPSISTSVGVIKNYFIDKNHILIVPPKNENKLTKAIEKLILDVNFRIKLSKNGFNQVQEVFNSNKGLSNLAILIKSTIN